MAHRWHTLDTLWKQAGYRPFIARQALNRAVYHIGCRGPKGFIGWQRSTKRVQLDLDPDDYQWEMLGTFLED